jgi:hypothetical protein
MQSSADFQPLCRIFYHKGGSFVGFGLAPLGSNWAGFFLGPKSIFSFLCGLFFHVTPYTSTTFSSFFMVFGFPASIDFGAGFFC